MSLLVLREHHEVDERTSHACDGLAEGVEVDADGTGGSRARARSRALPVDARRARGGTSRHRAKATRSRRCRLHRALSSSHATVANDLRFRRGAVASNSKREGGPPRPPAHTTARRRTTSTAICWARTHWHATRIACSTAMRPRRTPCASASAATRTPRWAANRRWTGAA